MNPFTFECAAGTADAARLGTMVGAKYLGGSTNLVDLMRETLESPSSLVDVASLSCEVAETPEAACA